MRSLVILLFSFFLLFPSTLLADDKGWEEGFKKGVDEIEREATENHLDILEYLAKKPLGEFFGLVKPHLSEEHYGALVKFMQGLQREALEEVKSARAALNDLSECRKFLEAAEKKIERRQRIEKAYVEAGLKRSEQLLDLLKKKLETEI